MKLIPKGPSGSKVSDAEITQLYQAILSLKDLEEIRSFLRDLLTETEIHEMTERWKVARMLDAGYSYTRIIEQTGLSSTTVARVAGWLKKGAGGYRLALDRLSKATSRSSSDLSDLPDLPPFEAPHVKSN